MVGSFKCEINNYNGNIVAIFHNNGALQHYGFVDLGQPEWNLLAEHDKQSERVVYKHLFVTSVQCLVNGVEVLRCKIGSGFNAPHVDVFQDGVSVLLMASAQ